MQVYHRKHHDVIKICYTLHYGVNATYLSPGKHLNDTETVNKVPLVHRLVSDLKPFHNRICRSVFGHVPALRRDASIRFYRPASTTVVYRLYTSRESRKQLFSQQTLCYKFDQSSKKTNISLIDNHLINSYLIVQRLMCYLLQNYYDSESCLSLILIQAFFLIVACFC